MKVDGTDNPSDLMTKHLVVNVTERHLKFLDMDYREGRSEKASQLHHVNIADNKNEIDEVIEMNEDEDKVEEGFDKGKSDKWGDRGNGKQWSRIHLNPRRALFTPYKIARGPGRKTKLKTMRTTEGTTELGQKFKIVDDWTDPERSHRLMTVAWIGKTTFDVDTNEDIHLGGDYRRQRERVQEGVNSAKTVTSGAKPRVSWADMDSEDDA